MVEARVDVDDRDDPLVVRINGESPTFRLETDRIEMTALHELAPELLDLLEIASVVFAADGSVARGGKTRPGMGDDWRRRFTIEMPVRKLNLWSRRDINEALVQALGFLTEDDVSFRFLQAPQDLPSREPYFDFGADAAAFEADEVILFSGGLDSFAGALDSLATTSSKVVLVTHRSAQKAITRQVELGRYLADRFPGRVLHLNVLARRAGAESSDHTQRSRSFLFAALGQAVAQQFGADRVSFYENGIMSHNLPISRQIVGTMATRTTHPLALTRLDALMQLVGPAAAPITNRFQWLTKTEVVRRIAENGAEAQIRRAVSCTSVREQDNLRTHCGACTQCLDRRFALLAAGLAEPDPAEIYLTDVLLGSRETTHSRTIATEWLRHALRLCALDDQGFFEVYGQEIARILRGHADLPRNEAIRQTLDMHHRHSRAVRAALEGGIRDHASQLADRTLPATSLLRLHLGDHPRPSDGIEEDPRLGSRTDGQAVIEAAADDLNVDLNPGPDAPLVVSFQCESGKPIIRVVGLGVVSGKPASVPHALRPALEEDRANGLTPAQHRFLRAADLPDLGNMSKEALRRNVARCRKLLADNFKLIHGYAPSRDLLIQSQQNAGYRLDPDTRIRDDSHS